MLQKTNQAKNNRKYANLFQDTVRKGDELPITVTETGGSGLVRARGHVKSEYSAREITEGPRVYRSKKQLGTVEPSSQLNIVLQSIVMQVVLSGS